MAVTHLIGHDAHNPNEHFIFATKFTSLYSLLGVQSGFTKRGTVNRFSLCFHCRFFTRGFVFLRVCASCVDTIAILLHSCIEKCFELSLFDLSKIRDPIGLEFGTILRLVETAPAPAKTRWRGCYFSFCTSHYVSVCINILRIAYEMNSCVQ